MSKFGSCLLKRRRRALHENVRTGLWARACQRKKFKVYTKQERFSH